MTGLQAVQHLYDTLGMERDEFGTWLVGIYMGVSISRIRPDDAAAIKRWIEEAYGETSGQPAEVMKSAFISSYEGPSDGKDQ